MLDKNEIINDIKSLKESFILRIKKPTLDDLCDAKEFYNRRIKEIRSSLKNQTYINCLRLHLTIRELFFKCLYDYFLEVINNIINIYHDGMVLSTEKPINEVVDRLIEEVKELLGD